MEYLTMTLTTGYEITTAATNLFNAVIMVILMGGLFRMKGPSARKAVWGVSFGLFLLVCLIGTYVHGVQLSPAGKAETWSILYIVMAFMVASMAVSVLYEIHGPSVLKKAVPAFAAFAVVFAVLRLVISPYISNGFILFLIYCAGIQVFLIIKLLMARKEKPYLMMMVWSILVLIAASVLQSVKSIKFHLIWDFNYNAVYHLVTLVFLIMMYYAIKRAALMDTAENTSAAG